MRGNESAKCLPFVCDGLTPVAKGSISEVTRFCKRHSCALCRDGVGHRAFLFSYRLEGRKRCAYVPADAVEQVRQALANGREVERRLVEAGIALIASHGRRARSGSSERSGAAPAIRVGVLSELNVLDPAGDGYYRDLANNTLRQLRARGMDAALYCGSVRPGEGSDAVTCPEFWRAVQRHGLDAAVILNVPVGDAWARRIAGLAMPAVGYNTAFEPRIDIDGMIRQSLTELRLQGARRIALLAWDRTHTRPLFEQTACELGLETRGRWIGGAFEPALPGSGWEAFHEIWAAHEEKPDGLLVLDDRLFEGAAQAILGMRIDVPGALRVATHAVRTATAAPPRFPHVRYVFDPADEARALTDLLERRLAGEPPPEIPPHIPFSVEDLYHHRKLHHHNKENDPCPQERRVLSPMPAC